MTGYPIAGFMATIAQEATRFGKAMVFLDTSYGSEALAVSGADSLSGVVSRVFNECFPAGTLAIWVIMASSQNQPVFESANFGGGHGAFSYALIAGLNGAATSVDDGTLSWGDLAQYVQTQFRRLTNGAQSPQEVFRPTWI